MTSLRFRMIAFCIMVLLLTALFVAGCKMTAPTIVRTDPPNQATNVPISPATVSVTFDQPMVAETVNKAITITPLVVGPPKYSWANGDRTVVVTYPNCFQPNTTYTVTIGGNAKAANNVTLTKPQCFSFTTAAAAGATETAPVQPPPPTQPTPPGQPAQPAQPPQPAQATLTFTKDIQPLAAKCDGCHASMATGKMSVYSTAMKYVKPNQPDQSPYLLRPSGNNHPNIWGAQAATVRDWISQGAKE